MPLHSRPGADPAAYRARARTRLIDGRPAGPDGGVSNTVAHDDHEFAIDIGENGKPLGYEIRFASKHHDVIAEALQILQRSDEIAVE